VSTTTLPTISVDGMKMAYSDAGDGPPVLLLHGWPTSSYLWREIAPRLASEHRVIAPDLPGFGASSKPVGTRYSFEFFERTLDALADELGLEQIGLAGHDLGGPIGVHWALARPGRVSRLALLNTLLYPEFAPAVVEFVTTLLDPVRREQVVSAAGLTEVMRLGVSDPAALPDETLAAVRAPFDTPEARQALAEAGIGLAPKGFEEIARGLPGLEMPVLGLYGAEDRILPDVAETFARVKRDLPHAEIVALPGVGHFLQEEAPEPVAARLARFFAA
jgi:pimeloyl-ACP methyl ester carboxylesterase